MDSKNFHNICPYNIYVRCLEKTFRLRNLLQPNFVFVKSKSQTAYNL